MGKWKLKTSDETDPTVPQYVKIITESNIANWNVAFANNHTHSNKSVLDGIGTTNVTNWNAAFAWGDHSTQGYLKNYTLPVATSSVLGGVKTGSRVTIAADGTISANAQSWTDITGKPNFATVATSGNYNDLTNRPTVTSYTLPVATATVLGGVKKGDRVTIAADGIISADRQVFDYTSTEQQLGTKYLGGWDVQRISWMYGNVSGNFNIPLPITGTLFRIIDISGSIQATATSPIYPLNYNNANIFFRAYVDSDNRLLCRK
jgi:antitoxin (DNA-binding transcriptional repressor) of toxin-antitoxin stability system